jgi:hypothetical protein
MSVKSEIVDGLGTGVTANVTPQNALLVSVLPQSSKGIPPNDLSNLRQLREYLVDSGGSNDQRVDGSTTPVEFTVSAAASITKWVTGIKIVVESTQLDLVSNEFRRYGSAGGATGLTNGIEIEAVQSGTVTSITAEPVRNMGRYLNWAENNYINLVGVGPGGADYVNWEFTFTQPIVLTEGSSDKVVFRVNDDLTSLTTHFTIARGYQEFV